MVETLFITDFKFSEAFANQIEAKVVAFQKYLTEQNNLKTIQVVANQTVVQAQAQANANVAKATGEAQAITIITEQLKHSPQYLQWQSINKWNGQLLILQNIVCNILCLLLLFQFPLPQVFQI